MSKILLIGIYFIFASKSYGQKPDWVDSPMKGCSSTTEICAAGTGTGRIFAQQNALQSLASYFESQIKGSTISGKGMSQKTVEDAIVSSEVDESVQTAVATFTDQVIEGAIIRDFYEDDDYFYAHAVLDKTVAAKKIKTEIISIDERLTELIKENKRTTYAKLKMRYKLREKLNKRYEFLSGGKVKAVIGFAQISKKKSLFLKKRLPLYVKLKGGELTLELEEVVKKFLVDQNYKILKKRRSQMAAVLGQVDARKAIFTS